MSDDTALLLERHFDLAFAAPDGIKKLRELILTLAMQGKLVPQDPNDQPASELLKEIEAEKKQLVKAGKIKQQKPLPEINAEEVPYEVPEGWEWCRVWDIAELITSGSRDWAKYYSDCGSIFVTMGNLSRGNYSLRMENIRYVRPPIDGEGSRTKLEEHDLLISITGDVGNLGLIPENFGDAYINQHTCLLRFMPSCRNRYFPELMRSSLAKSQFDGPQRGIKNSFRLGDVSEMIIPLPPLPEQHRIVAKIDQLMARCDELEKLRNERNQKRITVHTAALNRLLSAASSPSPPHRQESSRLDSRLRGNDAEFPGNDTEFSTSPSHSSLSPSPSLPRRRESSRLDFHPREQDSEFAEAWSFITQHFGELYSVKENVAELRKVILQLVVMGKLVPQDPNDQPASELLKEIEAEKKRLVKDGKIKPQKPLLEIKAEEVPYKLPDGWEWVRLHNYGIWKSGTTPSRTNSSYYGGDIPWVKSGEVKQGRIVETSETITQEALKSCSLDLNSIGSVLVAMYGANIGEVGVLEIEATTNQAVCACKPYLGIDNIFLVYLLTSLKQNFIGQGAGAAQPNISREKIIHTIVPLLPLAEQHRIVAKIDQLMALCDHLEQQIDAAASKQTALLSAVMAQV